jgi:hypothetical protein
MRLLRHVRNPPAWLRATLLVFALGFAINTVAHAGHAHDPASVFSQHSSCGHCVQLGHLADAPRCALEAPVAVRAYRLPLPKGEVIASRANSLTAKPRGPPFSEIH